MKTRATAVVLALTVALSFGAAWADTNVTMDSATINLGYMNVSNLPSNGGAFQFGSGWGIGDLVAVYAGDVVTMSPNVIGDPDPYWYIGGGMPGAPGNKIMEANLYAESNGPLAGQTVTFTGEVLATSLTSAHTVIAFVKDYAPDFSSFNVASVPLNAAGQFSVSLATVNNPARHVQWGLQMTGVNVWVTDVAPFGNIVVGPYMPVSEESSSFGGVKALFR